MITKKAVICAGAIFIKIAKCLPRIEVWIAVAIHANPSLFERARSVTLSPTLVRMKNGTMTRDRCDLINGEN